jgi:hypothetical protein
VTPSKAEIMQAVARGWCAPENAHKVMDPVLVEAIAREVLAITGHLSCATCGYEGPDAEHQTPGIGTNCPFLALSA